MIELLAAAALGLHVQTSLAPRPVLFGDAVTAHVDVLGDARSVRVDASFAPWQATAHETTSGGKRSFRYTLSCLDSACLPRTFRFPPVTVTAQLRNGRTVTVRRAWPALAVVGRFSPAAVGAPRPPFRADTALPAPSYAVAPGPLALALDVVAGLLAAVAAALVAFELLRRARLRGRFVDTRPPLVRALALVREAERRPPPDRRKAVALLARTLEEHGLAERAARVAWSPEQPSPERLEQLADEVERRG